MTALEKIKGITEFLKGFGIEDADKEAEIIVTHCLGIDKAALYRDNPVLSEKNVKDIDAVLQRRVKREPLQYILGYVEFCGLKIKVGKGVLIPRPETELLAEEAIKTVTSNELRVTRKDKNSPLKILDLCTGSGCLALSIAKHFPNAEVYGTDISKDAIRYANENARLNDIKNVTFLKGSLFEPLKQIMFSDVQSFKFDVIVSNPPYIRSGDIANLQPEINKWEPRNALDGGEDGLNYYRTIFSEGRGFLAFTGVICLEIGEGQACEVSEIAMQNCFRNISVIKDYAGIERIIAARAL